MNLGSAFHFSPVGRGFTCPERSRRIPRRTSHALRLATSFVLATILVLAACDNDFERNAYRTLKVAKVEYELLQEHAARSYLAGRLTREQWDRFALAGNRFIAAHTLAADLMKTYQQVRRAGDAEEKQQLQARVEAALVQLLPLLADLRSLLNSFQPDQPAVEE
ncbi:hypothetical protein MYX77_04310 [Acidobacteriia bacterium AH_259_A11_L15]|nr:hypothetical protein [Acidobacteriia bacterium AH_259_A11_L15]